MRPCSRLLHREPRSDENSVSVSKDSVLELLSMKTLCFRGERYRISILEDMALSRRSSFKEHRAVRRHVVFVFRLSGSSVISPHDRARSRGGLRRPWHGPIVLFPTHFGASRSVHRADERLRSSRRTSRSRGTTLKREPEPVAPDFDDLEAVVPLLGWPTRGSGGSAGLGEAELQSEAGRGR